MTDHDELTERIMEILLLRGSHIGAEQYQTVTEQIVAAVVSVLPTPPGEEEMTQILWRAVAPWPDADGSEKWENQHELLRQVYRVLARAAIEAMRR